jgi:hypothetical protein
VEAKGVESEFKNSYARVPQSIILPLASLTETIASVHVRVVVSCQIDCVIVKPEVSAMNIVLSIVMTAFAQFAITSTVKPRAP